MDFGRLVPLTLRTAFALLAFSLTSPMANAQDAASQLQSIAKENSLDVEGKPPFHLRLAFQMNGLDGKPSDTGTVEEWWASPVLSKTVFTTASMKSTEAVLLDSGSGIDPRELYFAKSLLSAVVHPVLMLGLATPKTEERDRAFSGITLKCLNVEPTPEQGTNRQLFSYCAQKDTDALRFQLEGNLESTARNQIGSFHDTEVALSAEIEYGDRLAISGKVVAMQSFDPTKSNVQLSAPASGPSVVPGHQAGAFVSGHILDKVQPAYPAFARMSHLSGTVVLHAIISKEGRTTNLFALASPSEALTAAALDAVRQWTYQPFLLNGKPVEVETVINVNFMFTAGH